MDIFKLLEKLAQAMPFKFLPHSLKAFHDFLSFGRGDKPAFGQHFHMSLAHPDVIRQKLAVHVKRIGILLRVLGQLSLKPSTPKFFCHI